MNIFVSIMDLGGTKKTFQLRDKAIIIGRSVRSHVTVKDALASAQHLSIWHEKGVVYIEDLESKNGIFINGVRVLKQRIYINDIVRFGDTTLCFEEKKMDLATIKRLSHKSTNPNPIKDQMQLEVETLQEKTKKLSRHNKTRTTSIQSKLYSDLNKESVFFNRSISSKILFFRKYLAGIIDITLTGLIMVLPLVGLKLFMPSVYEKNIKFDLNLKTFSANTNSLIVLVIGIVLGMIFSKWNKRKINTSIGEKICKLNH